jgi:hypothetical protein
MKVSHYYIKKAPNGGEGAFSILTTNKELKMKVRKPNILLVVSQCFNMENLVIYLTCLLLIKNGGYNLHIGFKV